MKLSEGEVLVWQAVANVLAVEEPAELELLPDIIESSQSEPGTIGRQPGAFDMGGIAVMAHTLYAVAAPVVLAMAPKVFDAALDVSKDALKKAIERRASKAVPPKAVGSAIPIEDVRLLVARAAAACNLSARTANALADSLIVQVIDRQSGTAATHASKA